MQSKLSMKNCPYFNWIELLAMLILFRNFTREFPTIDFNRLSEQKQNSEKNDFYQNLFFMRKHFYHVINSLVLMILLKTVQYSISINHLQNMTIFYT